MLFVRAIALIKNEIGWIYLDIFGLKISRYAANEIVMEKLNDEKRN